MRITHEDMAFIDDDADDAPVDDAPDVLKFSLAGVQLKLSAVRADRGLTIPAHGRGRDWIVKLPDPRFQNIP